MRARGSLLLLPVLFLVACGGDRLPQLELSGSALGTTFSVSIVEPPETLDRDALEADILASLAGIDSLASTWRDDSELSAFNADHSIDWIIVTQAFCDLLSGALDVSRATDGAFDVTVGPLVNLWGFGPDGQLLEPPGDAAIAAAQRSVGYEKIEADCAERLVRKDDAAMYVDFSAWAKGFAVDELAGLLDDRDFDNYLVEIGGELRLKGHNSKRDDWAIAVEAPSTSQRVPHAVLHITDTSLATSGDYRNYFEHEGERYSHTIDPRTGRPVTHSLAAVTVLHESAAQADALATALLVLGPDDGPALARELDVAAYFLVRDEDGFSELTTPAFDQIGAQ
jgi:thiamine biosynthesis lipoprotein